MACTLSGGISAIDCFDGVGGVETVYIAEKANVSSITATAAQVTAIAMVSGKYFYEFKTDQEVANGQSVGTKNVQNGTTSYVQTFVASWRKQGITKQNLLRLLEQNPALVLIYKDNNGNYIMYGSEVGGHITTSTAMSGTAIADKNGYDWTFTANAKTQQYFVDSSVIAGITAPAS